jgi:hypothetical protein
MAAVYAYHTGVVDTSFAGVSITPSRQQFVLTILKNADGSTATAATPIVSTHDPVGTLVGTTGASLLNGNSH